MSSLLKPLVLAAATIALVVEAHPHPALHKSVFRPPWHGKRTTGGSSCAVVDSAPAVSAPLENIWKGLTNEEVVGLLGWLYDPAQGLNLTLNDDAGAWDNTVGVTELLAPNKTDALAYLTGGGPAPVRNARVGLFFGATEEPYTQNFVVGPIPVSEETTIAPLDYIYTKSEGKMPNYEADSDSVRAFETNYTAAIADIMLDIVGVVSEIHLLLWCGHTDVVLVCDWC
jgi:primary-amine oxidase